MRWFSDFKKHKWNANCWPCVFDDLENWFVFGFVITYFQVIFFIHRWAQTDRLNSFFLGWAQRDPWLSFWNYWEEKIFEVVRILFRNYFAFPKILYGYLRKIENWKDDWTYPLMNVCRKFIFTNRNIFLVTRTTFDASSFDLIHYNRFWLKPRHHHMLILHASSYKYN